MLLHWKQAMKTKSNFSPSWFLFLLRHNKFVSPPPHPKTFWSSTTPTSPSTPTVMAFKIRSKSRNTTPPNAAFPLSTYSRRSWHADVTSYRLFQQFHDELLVPIQDKLSALGPTSIDVILLCYPIPFSVPNGHSANFSVDNVLMGLANA